MSRDEVVDELARRTLLVLAVLRAMPDLADAERRWLEDRLLPASEMLPDRWVLMETRVAHIMDRLVELEGEINELRGGRDGNRR